MHLLLHLQGADIAIHEPASGQAYPWLLEVGAIRIAARAGESSGIQVGEAPNASVTLDNRSGRAVALVGRPLLCSAEIVDDGGIVVFAGVVARITYGRTVGLEIEA